MKTRAFWILQAAGWAAFVIALMLPWLGAYPISLMLERKIPMACVGLLTTLGLRWVYRSLGRRPLWVVGAVAVLGTLTGAVVWSVVVQRIEPDTLIRASLDRVPGIAYYAFVLAAWSTLYFVFTERERSAISSIRISCSIR
jgi:hypothetical protein